MVRCPGQDLRFWKLGDIFDVPCPHCGTAVEGPTAAFCCTGCEMAAAIRGEPVALHYATGDAAEQIVVFARTNASDVIVLGSQARAAAALALGSVAAKVLVHAHCPVMVVRGGPEPIRAQVATMVV